MGFLQKLFLKKKDKPEESYMQSKELTQLRELDFFMRSLLRGDHYVAKSEYLERIRASSDLSNWFQVLMNSGTLDDYCRKTGSSNVEIHQIISRYNGFSSLVDAQNEKYIRMRMETEREYLDQILSDCDPNIRLDGDQRRVVLTDEDYCLVVAGAGAGKTTTVAAKVKYLVDKQGIDPKDILVISYTNEAPI